MSFVQFFGALELGLVYGLAAIAVYLTFRVLDFPDLTVDGSFTLGAAVCSVLIVGGTSPFLATLAAFGAGMIAGLVTGFLHIRWKILGLLAGILTMTALYSINLRIMGRPNIALLTESTLFEGFSFEHQTLVILCLLAFMVIGALTLLLASHFGLGLRAAGINPLMSRAYGVSVPQMTFFALALSNGIVAFAGSLFAQSQKFADVSIGGGTIIVGLASVIVGESILRTRRIGWALVGCLLGSILYRLAIAFALNASDLGLRASDLNLITTIVVVVTLILPKFRARMKQS